MRGTARLVTTGLAVLVALVLQLTVGPQLGWPDAGLGVVPGLVLVVVVATALLTDTRFATATGFVAGLLLDLAPPADHVAGRWALALTVVGYLVGRLAHDRAGETGTFGEAARPGWGVMLGAVLGGSFVGTSVFALTGMVLGDAGTPVGDLISVVLVAAALDVLAALVVLPLMVALHRAVGRLVDPASARVTPRNLAVQRSGTTARRTAP